MKFSHLRIYHTFFTLFVTSLAAVMIGGGYYFWQSGPLNISRVEKILDSNKKLEEINNVDTLGLTLKALDDGDPRLAYSLINQFEQEVGLFDQIDISAKEYKNIIQVLALAKNKMGEMLNSPETGQIIQVMAKKTENFKAYVEQNDWKTLSRLANRLQLEIPQSAKRPSLEKMMAFNEMFTKICDQMEGIVKSSALEPKNKQDIGERINQLRVEPTMISNLYALVKTNKDHIRKLQELSRVWREQFAPEVTYQRDQLKEEGRALVLLFFGVSLILVCSLFVAHFLFKIVQKQARNHFEYHFLTYLKESLLGAQNQKSELIGKGHGEDFLQKFKGFKDYIHKRMGLGLIFQETLPFPSIILDEHLQVVWGNGLFYKNFRFEDYKKEKSYLHWEQVHRYTNLGDEDPLLLAVHQQISGIYQIQFRPSGEELALPYEMYVSPIETHQGKRIFITFYPLRSLEQTLVHQAKSMIGPVMKSIQAMSEKRFNKSFVERIEKDFDIAGISEVLQKLSDFNEKNALQQNGLMREIERLEARFFDHMKMSEDVSLSIREEVSQFQKINHELMDLKNIVVAMIDARGDVESSFNRLSHLSKGNIKDAGLILEQARGIKQIFDENLSSFKTVNELRKDFKKLREKIEDSRVVLNQSIDQGGMTVRSIKDPQRNGTDERINKMLSSIKENHKNFDGVILELSRMFTKLDVSLSKIDLIIENKGQIDTEIFSENLQQAKTGCDEIHFKFNKINNTLLMKDEEVVVKFKNLYDELTKLKKGLHNSLHLVDGHHDGLKSFQNETVKEAVPFLN
jgi:hypothetical protein